MALKKSTEQDTGVIADYFRIIHYRTYLNSASNKQNHSSCVVGLYASKATRLADKEPVAEISFRYPDNSRESGKILETRAAWYAYLKTLPDFLGAVDD